MVEVAEAGRPAVEVVDLVRAENAGHGIEIDAPDLTAEAFRRVIAAVRAGLPSGSRATPLPRLGGTCLVPD